MATQTLVTLDQFLSLPESEPDGTHYELSEGELISLAAVGYQHGVIVMNVGYILRSTLNREKFVISAGDVGFILSAQPQGTVRGADVAVNTRESVGANPPVGYFRGAPLLAVEVVSPSNTAADLERKVSQYLSAGTLEVWLLYPETKTLYVHTSDRQHLSVFKPGERFSSVLGHEFDLDPFFE